VKPHREDMKLAGNALFHQSICKRHGVCNRYNLIGNSAPDKAGTGSLIYIFVKICYMVKLVGTLHAQKIIEGFFMGGYILCYNRIAEYRRIGSAKLIVNSELEPGIVISQITNEGRSMMVTAEGIKVQLSVSTGTIMTDVPNVINMDYRDAIALLNQAGFPTSVENAVSDTVPNDCVMATSPAAGEQISAGATVYLTVSSGDKIAYVSMPNLIGLTEDAAIAQLQSNGLSYGGTEKVDSDLDAGTVIGQSVPAFSEIEEHTSIILKVSRGPNN